MTSRDFCYWLQGYFEVQGLEVQEGCFPNLTPRQVQCVKKHLNMVFIHEIDPSMGDKAHQAALTAAHGGGSVGLPPFRQGQLLSADLLKYDPLQPTTLMNC